MPLDLIKRSEVTTALTAEQYDATMTAIDPWPFSRPPDSRPRSVIRRIPSSME